MTEPSISTKVIEEALAEATIRLAWYIKNHGGIPVAEATKLQLIAHGLRQDAHAVELLAEARSIKNYFLEICARRDVE